MVAKKDKTLIDIVKEQMELRKVNVRQLAARTDIPADRIYKWFQRNLNPKVEDADRLREWLSSNNGVVNVPREPLAREDQPPYRTQLWMGKLESDSPTAPLVTWKARAGYSKSYEDIEYLKSEFDDFQIPPGVPIRGSEWMWFEVGGTSMVPVLAEGDFILCSLIGEADWEDTLRNEGFKVYVVVWKNEVSVKRVAIDNGDFILISENEEEEQQKRVRQSDVKQLWKVRRRLTAQLPPTKRFKITV